MALRVACASAEMAPFAKTGGLGDVCAAVPRYLQRRGHDVRPFLPLYGKLDRASQRFTPVEFLQDVPLRLGTTEVRFSVFTAPLPPTGPPVYFVACPPLYGRPAIYSSEGDEHLRFALLSLAALECCQRMGFAPHVFHCHDWHSALVPLYLKTLYGWDRLFRGTRTVLTVHNLAYQGVFPAEVLPDIGLRGIADLLDQRDLHARRFGFLKTGLLHADAVTAVSETYAREIQTEEHGLGLEGILRARSGSVHGIVNGVDYEEWSPERDALIPARFTATDLAGKAACRDALLERSGLAPSPRGPVLGVVSRLTGQKGLDLLFETLPPVLRRRDVRFVALGSGDPRYEESFAGLAERFPGKAAFHNGYDNALAHLIEAGADVFLMPSRFEPCGLNQMYSLRYGTIPVVRRTGGLADTVRPWNPAAGTGTGFVFEHFSATGMAWALDLALRTFEDRGAWKRLVANAMAEDFSWERQILKYEALYESLSGR